MGIVDKFAIFVVISRFLAFGKPDFLNQINKKLVSGIVHKTH